MLTETEIEAKIATAVAKCFVYALSNTENLEEKTRKVVKDSAHDLAGGMLQELLWSGKAELHNGMLCGYQGDPKERIQAPDQIVTVYVEGKKNGGKGDGED